MWVLCLCLSEGEEEGEEEHRVKGHLKYQLEHETADAAMNWSKLELNKTFTLYPE